MQVGRTNPNFPNGFNSKSVRPSRQTQRRGLSQLRVTHPIHYYTYYTLYVLYAVILYVVIHHHALDALERHVRTIRPPRHPDQQCRHQHRALARRRSTGRKILGNHAGRVRRVIDVNLVAAFLMTRGADADGCSAGAHHQCHVAKTHAALWRLQGRQRGNSHCAGAGTRRQRRHR